MILHAHPMGNAFAREAARAMVEAGVLAEHWTALDWPERESWLGWMPEGWRRQMRRRRLPAEVKPFARLRPGMELGRLLMPRLGRKGWDAHEHGRFSVDRVMRDMDERIARRLGERGDVTGVYLYEDGAAESFAAARRRGVKTIYDLPIGYWRAARRWLTEEAERRPEWAATLHGNRDSEEKLARKDRELALADEVVVASSFTRATLAEAPEFGGRVTVVPYGAPVVGTGERRRRGAGEALRVLFVGSLGQRKGTADLLEAVAKLGSGVALTLIGTKPQGKCVPLEEGLRRHRWIPSCPHAEVLAEMRAHDVLVFPSLFEGFGLVILEAMSQGMPVITTAHTAGPDVITEGVDGFVVPIRAAEVIAEKLEWLRAEPGRAEAMGEAARVTAGRWGWERYRAGLGQLFLMA